MNSAYSAYSATGVYDGFSTEIPTIRQTLLKTVVKKIGHVDYTPRAQRRRARQPFEMPADAERRFLIKYAIRRNRTYTRVGGITRTDFKERKPFEALVRPRV